MKEIFYIILFLIPYSIIISSNIPELSLISREAIELKTSSDYNYFYMNSSLNISSDIEFCFSTVSFKLNKTSYCFTQDDPNIDTSVDNCDFIDFSPYRIYIESANSKKYYHRIYIKNKYVIMRYSGNKEGYPFLIVQSLDINNNSSKTSLPAVLIIFISIGALAFAIILIVFIVTICKKRGLVCHHGFGGHGYHYNHSRPLIRGYRRAHRFGRFGRFGGHRSHGK